MMVMRKIVGGMYIVRGKGGRSSPCSYRNAAKIHATQGQYRAIVAGLTQCTAPCLGNDTKQME